MHSFVQNLEVKIYVA